MRQTAPGSRASRRLLPPLLLHPPDLAQLRGKILDRGALVVAQRVARQLVDQHLEDVANAAELPAVGADLLENVGFDLRRAGASEVDGEPAEPAAGEIRDPVPRQDVLR